MLLGWAGQSRPQLHSCPNIVFAVVVRAALALVVRRCCHIYVIVIVLARLSVFIVIAIFGRLHVERIFVLTFNVHLKSNLASEQSFSFNSRFNYKLSF